MPSLVLTSDTLEVRLKSRRVEVLRRNPAHPEQPAQRSEIPLLDVERLLIIGQPSVSLPVLVEIMDEGIPCFFLTSHGRWRGSLSPDKNQNALRRVRQYEQSLDLGFCLKVARNLIYAKLKNSRRVLQRLAANRELSNTPEHKTVCEELLQYAEKSLTADSLDELHGYEGMGAARYFKRLGEFFPADIPFKGRTRRPPRDEANALMSWSYTILLGELEGAVRAHGLDASLGVFHEFAAGRPSLALDLLEPLRAPVADLLVLNILNHNILKKEHFEIDSKDGGTYLKESARKPYFIAYEQSMTRQFCVTKDSPHTDLRKVLDEQVCTYLRMLEKGTDEPFFLLP